MLMSEAIKELLEAARSGDAAANRELFSRVYAELKVLARSHRRRWQGNDTINGGAGADAMDGLVAERPSW